MTLSKKKSRTITVENKNYRWVISTEHNSIVLIIESEEEKGQKIKVYIEPEPDNYYVSSSEPTEQNIRAITPKDVSMIISKALIMGWNPLEKGSSIIFDLEEKRLINREN